MSPGLIFPGLEWVTTIGGTIDACEQGMIDVALCMLALVAGGVSLEVFCATVGCPNDQDAHTGPEGAEFECGNPS